MAIKIQSDGTFSIEYEGPYTGLDVQNPGTLVSDKATPSMSNFMLRNAQLCSRPNFQLLYPGFPLNPPYQTLGITTFLDANGVYHTVGWASLYMYQFNPSQLPGNPWQYCGAAAPGNMQTNPVAYQAFANKIYYTNTAFVAAPPFSGGSGNISINPFVGYWDGIAAAPVFVQTYGDLSTSNSIAGISLTDSPTVGGSLPGAPTIVGPISIGAAFIAELNNQIILANVTIADQGNAYKIYNFPNLLWWCASGLPLQWDPTQNTSAGFNPFLDVADQITGLAMLGVAGYIFRTYGITQMAPTGSLYTPWQFDHMWASNHGIGNVLPWSIAQYGPSAAFIAQDNVYSLSIVNANPIGGKARDAIMTDIANSTGTPFANILPILKNGYTYLTYVILIPLGSFTRQYTYSFEDQNWSKWDMNNLTGLYCSPNVV